MNISSIIKNALILLAIITIGSFFYIKVYLPKITFSSVSVMVKDINETVFGVGTIEAKEIILLAPKTTSKVLSLFADQGDTVGQEKILATMDPSDLLAVKEEALMSLKKSQMSLLAQQSLIKELEAKYHLAHTTLTRYENLTSKGFAAQAELDIAIAAEQSAKAQLENATAQIRVQQADVKRNESLTKSNSAKIEDLILRSPSNMLVISRDAEIGTTVPAGVPVFRLVNPDTIWVKIYINERQSGSLHVGQSASVHLRSHPEKIYKGHIARIGLESDRVTEEREINITLDNPPLPLYLGERAEATIHIATHPSVLTLPQLAITTVNGENGVWVNNEGKAHFKPLTLHVSSPDGLIMIEGVNEKDTVILPAGRDISEGMRVKL
ncbi:MAG: efflux RND transporter periplasmic adaptor subunit [Sulfurospirillaceae bacterium]|nr:efflux RND transporter periplasmic adaptor subunit [Sulfurospirillaceae bacterium]MDD2827736.1 efflux RND transporter periplasmic adaptor subunit [Sulfurospirillaceae bacterium]